MDAAESLNSFTDKCDYDDIISGVGSTSYTSKRREPNQSQRRKSDEHDFVTCITRRPKVTPRSMKTTATNLSRLLSVFQLNFVPLLLLILLTYFGKCFTIFLFYSFLAIQNAILKQQCSVYKYHTVSQLFLKDYFLLSQTLADSELFCLFPNECVKFARVATPATDLSYGSCLLGLPNLLVGQANPLPYSSAVPLLVIMTI